MAEQRRRILRRFAIDEISGVDAPAQPHARVALMKRADQKEQHMELRKIQSFATLDEAVAAIEKAEGCPRHEAMSRAASRQPELVAKYNAEGQQALAKAFDRKGPLAVPPAVCEFNALVEKIEKRDGCPRVEAMRRARTEAPALFAQYQAA